MLKASKSPASSGARNIAILFGVIAGLYLARAILVPLAFAVTLALILTPAIAALEKLRIRRVPAALLVMVASIVGAGVVGWVIFNELVDVANQLPGYRQNINRKLAALRAPGTGPLGRATASVTELGNELAHTQAPVSEPSRGRSITAARTGPVPVQIVAEPANEMRYVRDMVQPFLEPLGTFGMVLIFSLFLIVGHDDLRDRIFRLVGVSQLNVLTTGLDDATRRVGRYLMLQLLVNAGFGFLCGLGLFAIGVPYAMLWGTVAAILRIVPYAGSLVSAALPLLLSLAVFDHWMRPLLVFLLFAILELVTGSVVEPWLYGAHTGVSSLALILTTVFWTVLWGPAGLILSTPLTVCVVVLGRYVPQFSFLHTLLGDEPALVEEAQFYQRLLAMDDMEARSVVDRYLGSHSVLQLCDSVMIPALTLAEHDRHKGALDASREEFLFLSVREMMTELAERAVWPGLAEAESEDPGEPAPSGGRILCVPASDEADEVTAEILSMLLEHAGRVVLPIPRDPGMQVLAIVRPGANDVFCISALPPFAFAHARTVSYQLRVRFPGVRIVVCVWGFAGDTVRAMERFQAPRPDVLVTSMAAAIQAVGGAERVSAQVAPASGRT